MERVRVSSQCEIVNGDCIELLKTVPDATVDMILTDPPYGINYRSNRRKDGRFNQPIANDTDLNIVNRAMRDLYRVLKPDSVLYMFCASSTQDAMAHIIKRSGFRLKNRIVWDKKAWTAGDCFGAFGFQYEILFMAAKGRPHLRCKRSGDIWRISRVHNSRQVHQNEKPVELLVRAIESFTDPGMPQRIFDPFMGSGSTGEACAETGKSFLGCELDPKYFWPAADRLVKAYGPRK